MSDETPNIDSIFCAAVEIPASDERAAYLDRACADRADLRRRIDKLLDAHFRAGSFLDAPAPALAATIDSAISERVGSVIGPYRLMEQIGEGGMGLVFVADQQEPVRRRVALKIIKPGMDTREVIARFEAERQALALMDHPNIARVLDAGSTASGRPYFVMELVKGIPIIEYCDQQQLTARQRLELFLSVCRAVQHAHGKGIIHRDLKPNNILVAPHDGIPVVKVIDFGVAKAIGQQLTDKTIYTRFTQMIGTPLYMSPEQAEINALDVDIRSDVYSLGVLLYELLTGTTPFERERFATAAFDEIRRIIREEEPPKPSTRLSTLKGTLASVSAQRKTEPAKLSALVRGELDWIVMKALEKDRNRRYETASAVGEDIERYLHDEPVRACPPSSWYRFRKFSLRNRVTFAMGSVVVVTLATLGVAGHFAYRGHLTEQQRVVEQIAYEERLLAEKLERALMAAMSGEFDRADKAIVEAELMGASTGQAHMLRGVLAFHRGDMDQAIHDLEQAAKLHPAGQPGAVAVRAMLAQACMNDAAHLTRFAELSRELDQLSPMTPEDFLFKGLLETTIHPERGTQTLDEGIRQHNSVLARATRLEARANRALVTGDVGVAEQALKDAEVAREMLPGNPLVLSRCVFAHLVAAGIYETKGQAEDGQRALAHARRLVQELEPFSAIPFAAYTCFEYFEYVGDEEAAYAMSERGNQFRRAVMLYRRGEFSKAFDAAVERSRDRTLGPTERIERALILAELSDGPERARRAFEEVNADGGWQLTPPMILLFLGEPEEARRAFLQVPKEQIPDWDAGWYFKFLDYNCGRITADALLQAANESRSKVCDAHLMIGLWRLSEGDRAAARDHFQQCVATRVFIGWEWPWVHAFLKRMDEDAAWPQWIPLKN